MRKGIYFLSTLLLLVGLSACNSPNDGVCKYDWDFNSIEDTSKTVNSVNPLYHSGDAPNKADPGWVDSGMDLEQDKSMLIQSSGSVDLCGNAKYYPTGMVGSTSKWTTIKNFPVVKDDMIKIVATGSYSMWGSERNCSATSGRTNARWDATCQSSEYRGLLVQVATSESNNTDLNYSELFDYNIQLGTSDYKVPEDGYIQFKHADHDDNVAAPNTRITTGTYSNNSGGYAVYVKKSNCVYSGGLALYGYIGNNPPDTTYDFEESPGVFLIANHFESGEGSFQRSPSNGRLWLRVIDISDKDYTNNIGAYTVYVGTNSRDTDNTNWMVNLIHDIVEPVRTLIMDITKTMFNTIVGGPSKPVVKAIVALLVLYVIFSCIGFMFGIVQTSQAELVVRVVKLSIVASLLSPNSWDFFNTYLFNFFVGGMMYVVDSLFALYDDENFATSKDFSFATPLLDMLFRETTWLKFLGLLFAGPVGWVYLIFIIVGVIFYLMALIRAVILYLMSFIGLGLLFVVAPIFIPMVLFQDTKNLFDGWIKQLVNFTLQPMLVIGALILFNYWIYAILTKILGFGICWKCTFSIELPTDVIGLPKLIVCLFSFWMPEGFNNEYDIQTQLSLSPDGLSYLVNALPAILFDAIVFIIFAYGMKEFGNFAVQTAQALSQTMGSTSLMSAANSMMKGAGSAGGKMWGAATGGGKSQSSGGGGSDKGGGGGGGGSDKGGGGGGGPGSLRDSGGGNTGSSRSTGTNSPVSKNAGGGNKKPGEGQSDNSSSKTNSGKPRGNNNASSSKNSSNNQSSRPNGAQRLQNLSGKMRAASDAWKKGPPGASRGDIPHGGGDAEDLDI